MYWQAFAKEAALLIKRTFLICFLFLEFSEFEVFYNELRLEVKEVVQEKGKRSRGGAKVKGELLGKRGSMESRKKSEKRKKKSKAKKKGKKSKKSKKKMKEKSESGSTQKTGRSVESRTVFLNNFFELIRHLDKTCNHQNSAFSILSKYIHKINHFLTTFSKLKFDKIQKNEEASSSTPKQNKKIKRNKSVDSVLIAGINIIESLSEELSSDKLAFIDFLFFSKGFMELDTKEAKRINLSNKIYFLDNDFYKKHEKASDQDHKSEIDDKKEEAEPGKRMRRRKSSYENINELTKQDKNILVSKILKEYKIKIWKSKAFSDCNSTFGMMLEAKVKSQFIGVLKHYEFANIIEQFIANQKNILKPEFLDVLKIVYKYFFYFFDLPMVRELIDIPKICSMLESLESEVIEEETNESICLPALLRHSSKSRNYPKNVLKKMANFLRKTQKFSKLYQKLCELQNESNKVIQSPYLLHKIHNKFIKTLNKISLSIRHSEYWLRLDSSNLVYQITLKIKNLLKNPDWEHESLYKSFFEFIHQIKLENLLNQSNNTKHNLLYLINDISSKLTHLLKQRLDKVSKDNSQCITEEQYFKDPSMSLLESDIDKICQIKYVLNRNTKKHSRIKKLLKIYEVNQKYLQGNQLLPILKQFNKDYEVSVLSVSLFVEEFSKEIKEIVDDSELLFFDEPTMVAQRVNQLVEGFFANDAVYELLFKINYLLEKLGDKRIDMECLMMNDVNWFGSLYLVYSQFVNFLFLITKSSKLQSLLSSVLKREDYCLLLSVSLNLVAKVNSLFCSKLEYLKHCKRPFISVSNTLFNHEVLLKSQFRVLKTIRIIRHALPANLVSLELVASTCHSLIRLLFNQSSIQNGFLTIFSCRNLFESYSEWMHWLFTLFETVTSREETFDSFVHFFQQECVFENKQESLVFNFVDSYYNLYKQGVFDCSQSFDQNFLDWLFTNGASNGWFVKILDLLLAYSDYDFTRKIFDFVNGKVEKVLEQVNDPEFGLDGQWQKEVTDLFDVVAKLLKISHFKSFCLYEKSTLTFLEISKKLAAAPASLQISQEEFISVQEKLFFIASILFDLKIGIRAFLNEDQVQKAIIEDLPLESHTEMYIHQIMELLGKVLADIQDNPANMDKWFSLVDTLLKCVVLIVDNEGGKSVLLNMLIMESVGKELVEFVVKVVESLEGSMASMASYKNCVKHFIYIMMSFSKIDEHQNAGILNKFLNCHFKEINKNGNSEHSLITIFQSCLEFFSYLIENKILTSKKSKIIKKQASLFLNKLKKKFNKIENAGNLESVYNSEMPKEITQRYVMIQAKTEKLKMSFFNFLTEEKSKPKFSSSPYSTSFLEKTKKMWKNFQIQYQTNQNFHFNRFLFEGQIIDQIHPLLFDYLNNYSEIGIQAFFIQNVSLNCGNGRRFSDQMFNLSSLTRSTMTVGEILISDDFRSCQMAEFTPSSKKQFIKLSLPLTLTRRTQKESYLKNYIRRKNRRILENVKLSLLLINPAFKTIILQQNENTGMAREDSQNIFRGSFSAMNPTKPSPVLPNRNVFKSSKNILDNISPPNEIQNKIQKMHFQTNTFDTQKNSENTIDASTNSFNINSFNTNSFNTQSRTNPANQQPKFNISGHKKLGSESKNFPSNKTNSFPIRSPGQTPSPVQNKDAPNPYSFNPFHRPNKNTEKPFANKFQRNPIMRRNQPVKKTNYLAMMQGYKPAQPRSNNMTRFKKMELPSQKTMPSAPSFPRNFKPIKTDQPLPKAPSPKPEIKSPSFGYNPLAREKKTQRPSVSQNPNLKKPGEKQPDINFQRRRPFHPPSRPINNPSRQQGYYNKNPNLQKKGNNNPFIKSENPQYMNQNRGFAHQTTTAKPYNDSSNPNNPFMNTNFKPSRFQQNQFINKNPMDRGGMSMNPMQKPPQKLPSFPISKPQKVVPHIRQSKNAVWRPSDAKNQKVTENPMLRNLKFSDDEGEGAPRQDGNKNSRNDAFMKMYQRRSKY